MMASASSTVVEMGFSQSTCTPSCRAGITSLAWLLFSEQTTTASTTLNRDAASSKNRTPKRSAASLPRSWSTSAMPTKSASSRFLSTAA
jgi:hypothetical protein